ncbi:kinase-like domain-containing protein [Glomus cerebriforme]|uniref:Kinase-like domain-containing protein n=1 Tax=Glomus cerebriforme TaxID=658196 RepID=A0A397T147_9GLOM|nr:kinase-like domain-containing protein [Glomus cerebriforme]RIA88891.1 kinase-like domain-containing protein [Glomus cerebriforme]
MSSQVISRFEGRNYKMTITLTEEQKSVMIGSDDTCRKGHICDNETVLAPYHCLIYLQRDENRKSWKTIIQEKAMNPQKYVTLVNNSILEVRRKQWLGNNDEIKVGNGKEFIIFVFHDEFTRGVEERLIRVPESFNTRFKNECDEIGNGAHSIIYRAHDIKMNGSPKECVCKIVRISRNVTSISFKKLCQEPVILDSLKHINIIRVLGYCVDNDDPVRLLIWQEMMYGENLEKYINKVTTVNQKEWRFISSQILDALSFMHDKNIAHRDLKPSNIMWANNEHKILKLIDFGLAKNCNIESPDRDMVICGTPLYTPPEIHNASPSAIHDLYKPSVDIWAFGVCSFYFLTGEYPFFNEGELYDGDLLQDNIIKREIPKEPLRKRNIDEAIVELITDKILVKDPINRITAEGIINYFITTLHCNE